MYIQWPVCRNKTDSHWGCITSTCLVIFAPGLRSIHNKIGLSSPVVFAGHICSTISGSFDDPCRWSRSGVLLLSHFVKPSCTSDFRWHELIWVGADILHLHMTCIGHPFLDPIQFSLTSKRIISHNWHFIQVKARCGKAPG